MTHKDVGRDCILAFLDHASKEGLDLDKGRITFQDDRSDLCLDFEGAPNQTISFTDLVETPSLACGNCLHDADWDGRAYNSWESAVRIALRAADQGPREYRYLGDFKAGHLQLGNLDWVREIPSVRAWAERLADQVETQMKQGAHEHERELRRTLEDGPVREASMTAERNHHAALNPAVAQLFEELEERVREVLTCDPRRVIATHILYGDRETKWLLQVLYGKNGLLVLPMVYQPYAGSNYAISESEPDEAVLETMKVLHSEGGTYRELQDALEAAERIEGNK